MSFLKKLFNKEKTTRKITNTKELHVGDIIQLNDSFAMPEVLRGKQFEITAINSYEFERRTDTEWVLSGNDDSEIYLTLEIDDKTYLKFSYKIQHADVETLFDLDQFSTLFDEPGNASLSRQQDNTKTSGWSDNQYQQSIFAQVGYFHRKDSRGEALSQYQGKDSGEQFELYQLLNVEEDKGLEAEVWEDGDTDIFLTCYRPTTDIIDMYPGNYGE